MERDTLIQELRTIIGNDSHTLEDFSDIEICCENDLEEAWEIVDSIIEKSTNEQIANFIANLK